MPHYTESRTASLDWLRLPLAQHRFIGIYAVKQLFVFFPMVKYRNIQHVHDYSCLTVIAMQKHHSICKLIHKLNLSN